MSVNQRVLYLVAQNKSHFKIASSVQIKGALDLEHEMIAISNQ